MFEMSAFLAVKSASISDSWPNVFFQQICPAIAVSTPTLCYLHCLCPSFMYWKLELNEINERCTKCLAASLFVSDIIIVLHISNINPLHFPVTGRAMMKQTAERCSRRMRNQSQRSLCNQLPWPVWFPPASSSKRALF